MTCSTCNDARPAPEHYRLFAEGCIHCAARRIQYIQRRAMALGLPEAQIRAMAKRPEWQLQQPAQEAQPASLPAPRKRGRLNESAVS